MYPRRVFFLSALILFSANTWAVAQSKETASASGTSSITEGTAKTHSGISIHYLQSGNSQSPAALVLIPGWRLPAYLWKGQLQEFARTTRVIAIDPRSQGPSTKTTEGNTPEVRARDLHDVLAVLGISNPVLVGWSQGAQDVSAYVKEYGDASVAGIVLVDSRASLGPAEVKEHPGLAQAILSGIPRYTSDPESYSKRMVSSIFEQPHPELDIEGIVKATLQTPAETGAVMLIADIFGADRMSALTKLDKPALVVAASSSPELTDVKQMAAHIPGAQFIAIAGAGHAVFVDQPRQFNEVLRNFLAGLPH